jgi:hypothetical protein
MILHDNHSRFGREANLALYRDAFAGQNATADGNFHMGHLFLMIMTMEIGTRN